MALAASIIAGVLWDSAGARRAVSVRERNGVCGCGDACDAASGEEPY